ncbi:MAG: hypothetical protein JWM54_1667 [Acidobacteriaceae bacterium]|nr:hypothetical protein [Acidobacteriaceae bacterium]
MRRFRRKGQKISVLFPVNGKWRESGSLSKPNAIWQADHAYAD